uniref:SPRY domain containing 3 n=1 Tax=Neogobius melanostomus TaxID=47308 RepID=A0A8C6SDD4_9GOBI
MDDINLHYRFLNWRRRIREIRDVRAVRYRERLKRMRRDGDVIRYQGNSDEVGCFVAARPLSKRNRYFEVTIVDTGPGWLPNSVAFHADDGKLYNGNTVGQQFGPKCGRGDRIGCGIFPDSEEGQVTVFFTKNGTEVGSVDIASSPDSLFPAVGMHSLGEEVLLDLNAEWGPEDDEGLMIVDSHEEDWARLHDVKVTGTMLEYVGKGKSIMDVGLAQKCYIALGLARKDYPKNRHPGWSRGSIAYHADDGKLFSGSGVGDAFGPRCFEGDIMGCGIMFPRDYTCDSEEDEDEWDMEVFTKPSEVRNDLYANNEEEEDEGGEEAEEGKKVMVFFTRNGKVVGRKEVALPSGGFYPTIGMMSTGERVRVDLHPLSG